MARNLMQAMDAVDRAIGINQGLDALVSFLMSIKSSDAPDTKAIGEILWSIQKHLEITLHEVDAGLRDEK